MVPAEKLLKKTSESTKFIMLDQANAERIKTFGGTMVLLYSFTNIAAHAFSFPFSGISRVKDALRFHFRPLLGDAAGDISMIPFFTKNEKRSSSGCVFLLFGDAPNEESFPSIGKHSIWPVPMVFASEVDGSGIITYKNEESISTLWLDDWTPKYYAVASCADSTPEKERELAERFAATQDASPGKSFDVSAGDVTEDRLQRCGSATLAMCPAYARLDLSNIGASLLEKVEKLQAGLMRFGRALAICGALLLVMAAGVLFFEMSSAPAASGNAEAVYASAFGEESKQPLSSAREKLYSMGNTGVSELSLTELLRCFTDAWEQFGTSPDITIETMRFGAENSDVTGTAETNASIQRLKELIEEAGYAPQIDNIQRVPNGALRFNLSVTRGGRQ